MIYTLPIGARTHQQIRWMRFLTVFALGLGITMGTTAFAGAQAGGTRLSIDGRSNANPSIATSGKYVGVVWSAATSAGIDIFAALSHDDGRTFSPPTRVNDIEGDARVNSELPPRIALVPGKESTPEMVVVWTTKRPQGTRLLVARSINGGRSFGASRIVPGSDGPGTRGWESVTVDATGHVFVLWLDHRNAAATSEMHHDMSHGNPVTPSSAAPAADPTARARLSQLYAASLDGEGVTPITRGVCYCCKTSFVASGTWLYGVWRHVYPGSVRDIALTVSRDDGRTFSAPVRVSSDGWHVDGCPESGPALAVDAHHIVHVAWPAPPDGKSGTPLKLFYASSRDGMRFSPRTPLPTRGPVAHVQMAIGTDNRPIVVWDEVINGARHLAMARLRTLSSGRVTALRLDPPTPLPNQGWPVIAVTKQGSVVAWVSGLGIGNSIQVVLLR